MKKLYDRYLYAVYISDNSQNKSYIQYKANISRLQDYSAIDRSGIQHGALVSVSIAAADLQRVLTNQFNAENKGDLRIIEITSASLADSHRNLAHEIQKRFLTGKYHYPHIQKNASDGQAGMQWPIDS